MKHYFQNHKLQNHNIIFVCLFNICNNQFVLFFQNILQDIISFKHVIDNLSEKASALINSNMDATVDEQIKQIKERYQKLNEKANVS